MFFSPSTSSCVFHLFSYLELFKDTLHAMPSFRPIALWESSFLLCVDTALINPINSLQNITRKYGSFEAIYV